MAAIDWRPAQLVGYVTVTGDCAMDEVVTDDVRRVAALLAYAMQPDNKPFTVGSYNPANQSFANVSTSGPYISPCGYMSTSKDYKIGETNGLVAVTNSLLAHYAYCHLSDVDPGDWELIKQLAAAFEPMPDGEQLENLLRPKGSPFALSF